MNTPGSIKGALRKARKALENAAAPEAPLTAEILLAHVLGVERSFLFGHAEQTLCEEAAERFREILERRCSGEPTQYLTGVQEFYGLPFQIAPGALIPRPETELLVEETLTRSSDGDRIVDIGTGTGCIAVSVKINKPLAQVFACDISPEALKIAQQNARTLSAPVAFTQGNLATCFQADAFDLIACNPPYVPLADLPGLQRELRFEPAMALFGGQDGLDTYRRLAQDAARVVRPRGWLLLELGYNSRSAVEEILGRADWDEPIVRADLAGIDRVLAVQRR